MDRLPKKIIPVTYNDPKMLLDKINVLIIVAERSGKDTKK